MIIDNILGYRKHATATEDEINRFVNIIETNNKKRKYLIPSKDMWRSDVVDMYEQIGYFHIQETQYMFEEFKKDVRFGEFNEGCADSKYKAHFAFQNNGQWYYVLVLASSFKDEKKREFARENNINLVSVNLHELASDEWCIHCKNRENWNEYSERAEAIVCNKEVRLNWDICLEYEEKSRIEIIVDRMKDKANSFIKGRFSVDQSGEAYLVRNTLTEKNKQIIKAVFKIQESGVAIYTVLPFIQFDESAVKNVLQTLDFPVDVRENGEDGIIVIYWTSLEEIESNMDSAVKDKMVPMIETMKKIATGNF